MTGSSQAPAPTWAQVTERLIRGEDLPEEYIREVMDRAMEGLATQAALAGFLVALRAKGESITELRVMSERMLAHAEPFAAPELADQALDIVGTGGDGFATVNVSTMASVVAAGAGSTVIKHGNRAASSPAGSADVLERLGVAVDLTAEQVAEVARRCGITFCFARTFHPAMRHVAPVRGAMGIVTAFNFLGPLTNPAQPGFSAVGVGSARMAPIMAGVFAERGRRAVVFRGDDGLDEVTPATTTSAWWVTPSGVAPVRLDPRRVGFDYRPVDELRGADPMANADVARSVCGGQPGPVRDAVVLNAGLALALQTEDTERPVDAEELHARWADGIARARTSIDEGRAQATLEKWVEATQTWS
ncbi:anthranilate phosphoribosyltransferase [Ornithinimicrobium sp.]|uniref:anthranilate phosphoribosyltransferase n=1 Tax=Ornithinimicrobium sp. TaxID=1977084 RepID=UPI0039C98E4A